MEENIFNLDKIDDLPEAYKKQLKLLNVRDDTRSLLALFDLKDNLSIDEILVGMYRLYKVEKSRVWVSSTLHNLGKKGLIRKIDGTKGKYRKINKD